MGRQDPTGKVTKTGTVSSTALTLTAVGFTAAQQKAADRLVLSVTDDAVFWRKDGTAPTATVGYPLAARATPLVIKGNADIVRFQFIRETTDAKYVVELES